jgi:hypothetical protein
MPASLGQLSVADFESRVGMRFRLAGSNPEETLELLKVVATRIQDPAPLPRVPFHLLVRTGPGPIRPQGIYCLDSDEFGPLELFIVPARSDASGRYYCISFN